MRLPALILLLLCPSLAFSQWPTSQRAILADKAPAYLVVFIGESNSRGMAANSDATADELAPRTLKILNNNTLKFEALQIGVNNAGAASGIATNVHGWELELANSVDAGLWDKAVYIVKCGQGGSTIAEWSLGNGTGYWTTAQTRINAARAELAAQGKAPKIIVWYSQGVNDQTSGTSIPTWQAATQEFHSRLRDLLGANTPIIFNRLQTTGSNTYLTFNNSMDVIAAADPTKTFIASSTGAPVIDIFHWNYAGMKICADRLIEKTLNVSINEYSGTVGSAVHLTNALVFHGATSIWLPDTSTSGAGAVDTLTDLGTDAVNMTQTSTARPTAATDATLNGKMVLTFNGTAQYIAASSALPANVRSFVAVAKYNAATWANQAGCFSSISSGDGSAFLRGSASGETKWYNFGGVWNVWKNGVSTSRDTDGVGPMNAWAVYQYSCPSAAYAITPQLGQNYNVTTARWNGSIGLVATFPLPVWSGDHAEMWRLIRAYYGL